MPGPSNLTLPIDQSHDGTSDRAKVGLGRLSMNLYLQWVSDEPSPDSPLEKIDWHHPPKDADVALRCYAQPSHLLTTFYQVTVSRVHTTFILDMRT